jgi:molybdenum cofactor cytidylyltransferase
MAREVYTASMQSIAPVLQAVVLAAGSSTRLGHPKALLEIEHSTALQRILDVLSKCGIRSGVVVAGEHLEEMKARVDPAPLQYAINPSPDAGRMGSVMIGLAATDPDADILLWPVDRPLAKIETVKAILDARAREPRANVVIVPEYQERHGHPILIASGLRQSLLTASPDANLREVLGNSGASRVSIPGDPGIHANLDTEEDASRAAGRATSRSDD